MPLSFMSCFDRSFYHIVVDCNNAQLKMLQVPFTILVLLENISESDFHDISAYCEFRLAVLLYSTDQFF